MVNDSQQVPHFDPTLFERAAAALRELDASKNSDKALEVIKQAEVTKLKEIDRDIKKHETELKKHESQLKRHEADVSRIQLEKVKTESQEARNLVKAQMEKEMETLRLKAALDLESRRQHEIETARLAKKRMVEETREMEQREKSRLQAEQAIVKVKLEAEEKATQLKERLERARVREKYLSKAHRERMNHKIRMEQNRETRLLKMEEKLAVTREIMRWVGSGYERLMDDESLRRKSAAALMFVMGVSFGFHRSAQVAKEVLLHRMYRPRLVREWHSNRSLMKIFRLGSRSTL